MEEQLWFRYPNQSMEMEDQNLRVKSINMSFIINQQWWKEKDQ